MLRKPTSQRGQKRKDTGRKGLCFLARLITKVNLYIAQKIEC